MEIEGLNVVDEVKMGMMLAANDRDSVLARARKMEESGLDSIWVGDHIAFHIPVVESLSLLSFCAAATELRRLIREDVGDFDLSRLRLTVSAGESVNPEVLEAWQSLVEAPLLDGYGLERSARPGLVDRMIEFAIRSAREEAVAAGVTPDTPSPTEDGFPLLWAMTWRTRAAAWMLDHRSQLDAALSS